MEAADHDQLRLWRCAGWLGTYFASCLPHSGEPATVFFVNILASICTNIIDCFCFKGWWGLPLYNIYIYIYNIYIYIFLSLSFKMRCPFLVPKWLLWWGKRAPLFEWLKEILPAFIIWYMLHTRQETRVTECPKEDHVEKDYYSMFHDFPICLQLLVTLHMHAAPGRSWAGARCRTRAWAVRATSPSGLSTGQ